MIDRKANYMYGTMAVTINKEQQTRLDTTVACSIVVARVLNAFARLVYPVANSALTTNFHLCFYRGRVGGDETTINF